MPKKKVLVVGLDGLEPSLTESLLQRGELPALDSIRKTGAYRRLGTTYPAQTPVAWSSFVTGANPGRHGIFDFIRRNPETYQADVALTQFLPPKNLFSQPRVENLRKGTPVWDLIGKAELPATVLRCPCTFPAETVKGALLSGVGVPDLRGSQGKGSFYTQNRGIKALENEQIFVLDAGEDISTQLLGPRNTRTNPPSDLSCPLRLQVDRARGGLTIHTGGDAPEVHVSVGEWSDWIRVKFRVSMLQSISGLVRFYVPRISPVIELYASPVNFDPAAPPFPISYPGGYAKELADKIGLFSTLGMAEDHTGLNNGRFDEQAYVKNCDLVFRERERMLFHEQERFSEGLLFIVFDTPDRMQHMLWRFLDTQHPGYDPDLAREAASHIEQHYIRCDKMLQRVLERMDENTLLIVLSDHGFNSFRRAFDTNTWLWENQLLSFKEGKKPEGAAEGAAQAVDWSRTYAYAVGLGGIYLNLKGRESAGIVDEGGEADRVRRAVQQGLAQCRDTDGTAMVASVSPREAIYNGAYAKNAPDLLVNFHPGYRVSWESAVGGVSESLIQNNTRKWSGDHIMNPDAVPGVLFLNRPALEQPAHIMDLAPSILQFLDIPKGEAMEGNSLLAD